MLKIKYMLYLCPLSILITSCGFGILNGTGTHGMIQGYIYPISKEKIDSTIQILIANNDKIIKEKGDGTTYSTIIITDAIKYSYVYRYYGDAIYLKEHPNESKFFITSIKKDNEEYKINEDMNNKVKKEAISIFEKEIILTLDSMMNTKAIKFK